MSDDFKYKSLTSKQVEEELKRVIYRTKYIKILKSTIYSLIMISAFAVLIATLVMPVLQINSSSMMPTLNENEIVLSLKLKKINPGDIIAFYYGNKILVKRVIASAGEWVNIDEEGNVYVNGNILDENYTKEKMLGEYNIDFPYQVPDGHYFVLGDCRSISMDSRISEIGSISKNDIIGKIIFKIWPLNRIGLVK